MSRISIPPVASATGAVGELSSRIRKTTGGLPDLYAVVGALQQQVRPRRKAFRAASRRFS
jgi:hypothetical protein